MEIDITTSVLPQLREYGVLVEWDGVEVNVSAAATRWDSGLRDLLAQQAATIANELAEIHLGSLDRVVVDECGPLSPSQERLLSLELHLPGVRAVQAPEQFLIEGPLDVAALEASVEKVVARQGSLRTVFRRCETNQNVLQCVTLPGNIKLSVYDRSGDPNPQAAINSVALELASPFSLRGGPLARFALVRFANERHILMITVHHMVSDGWSASLLLEELTELYAAFIGMRKARLPQIDRSFASICADLVTRRGSERICNSVAYWCNHLAPPWSGTNFFRAQDSGATFTLQVVKTPVVIEHPLVDRLRAKASYRSVTLSSLLIGCFAATLHKRLGDQDIRIATMVANRDLPDVDHLIGFFSNIVVLRFLGYTDNSPFGFMEEASAQLRKALEHQEVPFQDIKAALRNSNPDIPMDKLYSNMFVVNDFPGSGLALPRTRCTPIVQDAASREYLTTLDLMIQLQHSPDGGLHGHLVNSRSRLPSGIIMDLWSDFLQLLESVAQ